MSSKKYFSSLIIIPEAVFFRMFSKYVRATGVLDKVRNKRQTETIY